MIQIEAPHFVAGVEITDGICTRAAPIVHYMLGWDVERIEKYVKWKRWKCTHLPSPPQ